MSVVADTVDAGHCLSQHIQLVGAEWALRISKGDQRTARLEVSGLVIFWYAQALGILTP